MYPTFRRAAAALAAVVVATTLAACGGGADAKPYDAESTGTPSGSWPRTITDTVGSVTLKEQPKNIVSTSVVLTGSLLAIDAPVKGSGASMPGGVGFDAQGFFTQWSDAAKAKGVKALYTKSTLNLEAVKAAKPDLIIVSATGGDSAKDQYAQLTKIAPTVSVDYNSASWEQVTTRLGEITGHEAQAKAAIADYAKQVAGLKASMTPPAAAVQAIAYQGENGAAFALPDGPHADVLKALGVTLAPLPAGVKPEKDRGDVAFVSTEVAVAGLTAKDVLLIDGDADTVKALSAAKAYQNVPALKGRLVPLGHPSFKLDYYSAIDMAKHVAAAYAK